MTTKELLITFIIILITIFWAVVEPKIDGSVSVLADSKEENERNIENLILNLK